MKMKDIVVSQARDIASQSLSIDIPQPPKGWIYTLRTALGMTGAQLGERLGVKKGRISQMEAMESQGRITVQQLARAADAMQCDLVIAFRPRQPVDQIVARQARKKALAVASETRAHMALEAQALDKRTFERELERLAEEFQRTLPRDLWDE